MTESENISARDQGLVILEQIHTIGLPTPQNIHQFIELADKLQSLSSHFHPIDQQSCITMSEIVHRMNETLEREGEIPVKVFAELNRKYIMLKTGLQQHELPS